LLARAIPKDQREFGFAVHFDLFSFAYSLPLRLGHA
jgi:hypothetical protein